MRAVVLTTAFGCLSSIATIAAGQQTQAQPAQIRIVTPTVASLAGGRVRLIALLTNVSDHSIEVDESYADNVDRNYVFHLAIDGGRELRAKPAGNDKTVTSKSVTLNPGKFNLDPICLSCVYGGFFVPGKYTFYLTHKVRSNGEISTVQSNEISFRVVPREGPDAPPPLEIKLTLPEPVVASGAHVPYRIVLINRSNHDLDCGDLANDSTYYLMQIFGSNGKRVPPIEPQMVDGSMRNCNLPVGETTGWESTLDPRDFPTLGPGKYTLRIEADNPDDRKAARIDSNPVTLIIHDAR